MTTYCIIFHLYYGYFWFQKYFLLYAALFFPFLVLQSLSSQTLTEEINTCYILLVFCVK